MIYDITKKTAPTVQGWEKAQNVSKSCSHRPQKAWKKPFPDVFPLLGAKINGVKFQYPDLTWKELCGQMANLVAESGGNKGQLSLLVEEIIRMFRVDDESEYEKLVA